MQGFAVDISDMVNQARRQETKKPANKPIPEVQIAELRAKAALYARNPFKVGDLVTPSPSSILEGKGHPFLVVEVNDDPRYTWDLPAGSGAGTAHPDYGARFNVRVMGYTEGGDTIAAWWNEAFNYDRYVGNPSTKVEN